MQWTSLTPQQDVLALDNCLLHGHRELQFRSGVRTGGLPVDPGTVKTWSEPYADIPEGFGELGDELGAVVHTESRNQRARKSAHYSIR